VSGASSVTPCAGRAVSCCRQNGISTKNLNETDSAKQICFCKTDLQNKMAAAARPNYSKQRHEKIEFAP
jgi:hypothetical protein